MATAVVRIAVVLALLAAPALSRAGVIQGPTVNPANGHTYYLLDAVAWTVAEAEAVTLGGHLASINDAGEQAWVFDTLSPAPGTGNLRDLWIGLSDAGVEGTYAWTNGDPLTFTNWAAGEPNNLDGTEDYVHITGTPFGALTSGSWNDDINDRPFKYGVVEIVPEPAAAAVILPFLARTIVARRRRGDRARR